jgi:hypothetical protein
MNVKLLIGLVLVVALAMVPVAGASDLEQERVGGPTAGGPVLIPSELEGNEFIGGPGAAGPILASDYLGYEPAGGPGAGGPIVRTAPVAATGGSDWTTIALGVVFALGLVLIAAGAVLHRRRETVAPLV